MRTKKKSQSEIETKPATETGKQRAAALAQMRTALKEMRETAKGIIEQVDELLSHETPEDVVDNIGEIAGEATGIAKEAENIETIEFPPADDDA